MKQNIKMEFTIKEEQIKNKYNTEINNASKLIEELKEENDNIRNQISKYKLEIENLESKIEEKENKNKLNLNKKGVEMENMKEHLDEIEKEIKEIEVEEGEIEVGLIALVKVMIIGKKILIQEEMTEISSKMKTMIEIMTEDIKKIIIQIEVMIALIQNLEDIKIRAGDKINDKKKKKCCLL